MGAAQETEDLLKALESHAGQESSSRECVGMLQKLRKLEMTPSILGKTSAGKRLKALSKQKGVAEEVATLAKQVVSEWKAMVMSMRTTPVKSEAPTTKPMSAEKSDIGVSGGAAAIVDGMNETNTTNGTNAVEAEGEAPTPTKGTGPNDGHATEYAGNGDNNTNARPAAVSATPTRAPTTTTEPEETGDALRDKIRKRLFDALCISRQEGVASIDEGPLACAIEQAMFETYDGTSAQYKTKFQQLHFNLKDAKNPDLRRKVVLGEIDPKELLLLAPEELASDAKREENQRIRDKKLFDAAPSQAKKATTDQFQCGKCRQRKCTYYQMQTRSAVGFELELERYARESEPRDRPFGILWCISDYPLTLSLLFAC